MSTNYLSYSGFKEYEKCPYAYWFKYVVKFKLTVPENGVNALYGTTIGLVFESFYKDQIWRHKDHTDRLMALADPYLKKAIRETKEKKRDIDWFDEAANYHSEEAILVDLYATIPIGVQTIRENRFVGPRMDAEFKLDCKIGRYIIGGRADFIIQRVKPFSDLIFLDGKGSKHRDLYLEGKKKDEGQKTEGTQLKWYAVLYREASGRIPDGLGYIFWRFEGERAIEWVEFSEADIVNLRKEILATISRIDSSTTQLDHTPNGSQAYSDLRQELFPAQPGDHCRLCSYSSVCEEGKKQKQKARPRPRLNLPEGVTELTLGIDD